MIRARVSGSRATTAVPSSRVMIGRWISFGFSTSAATQSPRCSSSFGTSRRAISFATGSVIRAMSQGSRPSRASTLSSSAVVGGSSR